MLASRLLSIVLLLQTRGGMTAKQLSQEFEVGVRTIHRDIDQLSAAGIPVYADRGPRGGFRLRDGYRMTLTGLTQAEAEALLLAGLPGPAAQLGLADVLATARLKLMAALPANLLPDAERIATRFHLDAAAWFRGADQLASLPIVARAAWSDHMLSVRYRRAGEREARPRNLAPLGLVLKGGVWYLVAQSGNLIRTYRAANISDAELCDQTFARPKNFDLATYWEKTARDYEAGLYRRYADVRLSPRGVSMLTLFGPHVRDCAATTAGKPDRRGWVRCRVPIENIDYGVRELLRLGNEVTVIGPADVRKAVSETAHALAQHHGAKTPPSTPRKRL